MKWTLRSLFKYFTLNFLIGLFILQIGFIVQILLLTKLNPISTSFMTNEHYRLCSAKMDKSAHKDCALKHTWVQYEDMGIAIKKAVIASEDANFSAHDGVEVDNLLQAWEKNNKKGKIISGGSTITQQLAKNLFLSSEKNYIRKFQELLLTFYIEFFLEKRRIFEIYLNIVEMGEGVFGVQQAAHYYFAKNINELSNYQAAKLAAALPAPKCFDDEIYCNGIHINFRKKAQVIAKRMGVADLPKEDDDIGEYIQKKHIKRHKNTPTLKNNI
jgi:monofunctional glycosyltransferase